MLSHGFLCNACFQYSSYLGGFNSIKCSIHTELFQTMLMEHIGNIIIKQSLLPQNIPNKDCDSISLIFNILFFIVGHILINVNAVIIDGSFRVSLITD